MVAHHVAVSEVLGDDGRLRSDTFSPARPTERFRVRPRDLTLGLSSWVISFIGPIADDPVAPVGRTDADWGSVSDVEVTSRWAPSRVPPLSILDSGVTLADVNPVEAQSHRDRRARVGPTLLTRRSAWR